MASKKDNDCSWTLTLCAEELLAQVKVEMLEAEGYDVDAKIRLQIIAAEEERIRAEKEEVRVCH